MGMSKHSYLGNLAVVCASWWLALLIFDITQPLRNGGVMDLQAGMKTIESSASLLIAEVFIALLCVVWNLKLSLQSRRSRLIALSEHSRFGLHSNMGEIQNILKNPISVRPSIHSIPDWLISSQQYEFAPLITHFIKITLKKNPLVASAMTGCLALLCQYKDHPSSSMNSTSCSEEGEQAEHEVSGRFVNNHHGHCSLLDHSLRVAAYALIQRQRFTYDGLRTELAQVTQASQDYEFDPEDPLMILLALVHDIGKIKTFQLNERNEVLRVKGRHGPVGASLLAHLDCIQSLPADDRNLLYKAMHHYHSPYHFTLKSDGVLDDERTAAYMMLLIKADKKASRAERLGRKEQQDHQWLQEIAPQGIESKQA
jgi:hypothetical protein